MYPFSIECKDTPVDKAHLVNSLNGEYALCHIETCNVLRESIVFNQHCHEVSTGEELHDKIKVRRILERVK